MQALIHFFIELCLLRRAPQDLPASATLLKVLVLAYLGVGILVGAATGQGLGDALAQTLVDTALLLGLLYAGLRWLARLPRFTQSASALLVPLGAAVRYELGRSSAPLIVLGLSAGPALISMDTSGGERLTGLTVYGRGSLGIRLPIGEVFGIAAEAGYDIYWERPYPIMGFCPAVYASMRL